MLKLRSPAGEPIELAAFGAGQMSSPGSPMRRTSSRILARLFGCRLARSSIIAGLPHGSGQGEPFLVLAE